MLKDVSILVAWSFEPLRTDGNEPCKFEIERALWTMLVKAYGVDSPAAEVIVANIAWLEVVPYILPYDSDRGKNVRKFDAMLAETNPNMQVIQESVVKPLPNVKGALIFGKRAHDFFFYRKGIFPKHLQGQGQDDTNYLCHPEVFVNKCACSDERRMSW